MDVFKTITERVSDDIFYEYDPNEVFERDAVNFHAMTSEHTEVLGQFLDYTAMDVEQLKKCLVNGFLSMAEVSIDESKFSPKEIEEIKNDPFPFIIRD